MRASFRFLSTLVLLLPLFSPIFASSNVQSPPSDESSKSDIICHGSKCYPRVFTPTLEWQIIEPDQQIPQGLHIRLNMQTGVKEGKINIPGEGSEYEAVPVELPPQGGSDSVVLVGSEKAPMPSTKPPPPNDDAYGAIKVPITAQHEELPFTDAVSVILDSKSSGDSKLNDALASLEGLVHEMYWGLQISTPENISALLNLIHSSTNPSIRKSAAMVIGSALQNNPKALKNTLGNAAVKDGEKVDIKLIETLVVALQHETDDFARLRIMYAISQTIKSNRTFNDFIRIDGLRTLLELFQREDTDAGEFKGKISTFVEDNFLDEDMKTEVPAKEHHTHHAHHDKQQILKSTSDLVNAESLMKFSKPFQESLINSEKLGITGDTVKIKILNALVALQKRFRNDPVKSPLTKEFEQWFKQQISGEQNIDKLEDEGQWFKIRALELKNDMNIS